MKTIRFGDLVRNSGRPQTLTLWTTPEKNRDLQQAIRGNRVLTVQRRNVGSKADVGEIGFRQRKDAVYLIFPRRLTAAARDPVIGINYDLLEEPAPSGSIRLAETSPAPAPSRKRETAKPPALKLLPSPKPTPRSQPRPAKPRPAKPMQPLPPPAPKPPPKPKKFRVVVRAVADTEIEVEALSQKDARARALQEAQQRAVPNSKWRRSVMRISEK